MHKILIVDDTQGIREMLSKQLRKFNYEILEAESGYDALKVLREKDVDLVLLDQTMPDMDGLETFEEIKKEILFDVPVIMTTAHGSLNLAVTFMKLGGVDFVEKPIDMDALVIKIRQALKQRNSKI